MALSEKLSAELVGHQYTHTAAADIDAGDIVQLADGTYGRALNDIASGETGIIETGILVEVAKPGSHAWAAGETVYWDDANDRATAVGSGLPPIGFASEPVGSAGTIGRVWLGMGPAVTKSVYTASGTTAIDATASSGDIVVVATGAAQAISIPAAATRPGALFWLRSGGAGAKTVTPAAGTIGGGATYAAADADGDWAVFVALGTDWVRVASVIA